MSADHGRGSCDRRVRRRKCSHESDGTLSVADLVRSSQAIYLLAWLSPVVARIFCAGPLFASRGARQDALQRRNQEFPESPRSIGRAVLTTRGSSSARTSGGNNELVVLPYWG